MSPGRKSRTPKAPSEEIILAGQIHQFFQAPDRSQTRSQIVQKVLYLLNVANRQWTERSIRLWFNNNKTHFLGDGRPQAIPPPLPSMPPPMPLFQVPMPPPYPYGYIPLAFSPMPSPIDWQLPIAMMLSIPPPPKPLTYPMHSIHQS
jgi:hypothetical protein